ncbi:MAG TPA: GNAT family N-acetyltransferase [Acidobacteriaceae bacterium]
MPNPSEVTRSRFELVHNGQTSYLEFETDDKGWLTLLHTEVSKELRGRGLAVELVTTAFQYARDHSLKVDILCPIAQHILATHPEFQPLVSQK